MATEKIKIYKWEDGKILERECLKSHIKYQCGWRTDPEEAMLTQLKLDRNSMSERLAELRSQIELMVMLEDDLKSIFKEFKTDLFSIKMLDVKSYKSLDKQQINETIKMLEKLRDNI